MEEEADLALLVSTRESSKPDFRQDQHLLKTNALSQRMTSQYLQPPIYARVISHSCLPSRHLVSAGHPIVKIR